MRPGDDTMKRKAQLTMPQIVMLILALLLLVFGLVWIAGLRGNIIDVLKEIL